jgi:glycosidase
VEPPPVLSCYAGRLDGCLDFHLCDLLRHTLGRGTCDLCDLEHTLARHEWFFPSNFTRPSFLDNHDTDRFLYIVKGDQQRLRLAAMVQMTLPGPPIVYYGTEVGLSQNHGREDGRGLEVSRLPMPWGEEQDRQLLAWYRRLIEIRRSHLAIWEGERTTLHVDKVTWVYALNGEGGLLIVALNSGSHPRDLSLDVAGMGLCEGTVLYDLLEGSEAFVQAGRLELALSPWSGGVWEAK